MSVGLRTLSGGTGPGLLVLLHGLGGTADVWTPMAPVLEQTWAGRWVAVDLPGHGGSPPLPRVSFGALATAVADALPADEPVVVLGHSLGGVVALTLASGWFGVTVTRAVGLGIKAVWSPVELAKASALADRPVSWFDSRAEAASRHLRVTGLDGLVDPDDAVVAAGLREQDGRWRLALDPRSFGVGAPYLPGLVQAARGQVVLACGARDGMVSAEQLADLVPDPVVLRDCGHNAHVERPELVAPLLG